MLKQRVLTASLLAPLALLAIFYLPLSLFTWLVTGISWLGLWEWTKFSTSPSKIKLVFIPSLLLIGGISCIDRVSPLINGAVNTSLATQGGLIVIVGAFWWFFAAKMVISFAKGTRWWMHQNGVKQGFGALTLVPFGVSVLLLRSYQYDVNPLLGAKLVLLVCLLVWAADTGAFVAGKSFGKHKMAPAVSPNKTIEGLIGGLIAAVIVMMVAAYELNIPFSSMTTLAMIAFITALVSVLGDLLESMFKRVAGIKDSGSLLPGHGGVLDRIDSLTAAFPVFTVLYFWLG